MKQNKGYTRRLDWRCVHHRMLVYVDVCSIIKIIVGESDPFISVK